MKVLSTYDISKEILEGLKADLGDDFRLDIDSQVALFSAEPPSWFTFIAEADWWIKAFAAYAALYVAEIVKEAGKDTWKNRGKAFEFLKTDSLHRMSKAILRALSRTRPNTTASVAIPIPSEVYTTSLRLTSRNEDDIAAEIALFVHHLPALTELLNAEDIGAGNSSGWIRLKFLDDGSLEVRWFERESLEERRYVLPFRPMP